MTKKIIGICLLILGATFFLWTGYNLVKNLTTTKQEMIEQTKKELAKKGISSDDYYTEKLLNETIDDSIKYGRIISPILMLIGAGIAFGGFTLYIRGKRNAQLSDTFKFG